MEVLNIVGDVDVTRKLEDGEVSWHLEGGRVGRFDSTKFLDKEPKETIRKIWCCRTAVFKYGKRSGSTAPNFLRRNPSENLVEPPLAVIPIISMSGNSQSQQTSQTNS